MAQTSKRLRALRRRKRRTSLAEVEKLFALRVNYEGAAQELYRCKALLFALLAQAGGSLEVTKGTQAHVLAGIERLSLSSALKEGDDQTLVVTLVEAPETEPEAEQESAVEITRIADDDNN